MPYEVSVTKRAEKELKKLPPQIRRHVITETLKLAENPHLGEQLKGKFRAFRSLHLKIQNVQYRVVYEIKDSHNVIYVYAVGTRENFYIRLERKNLKKAA